MFDYIIIGAGSAGCVLANRLSAHVGTSVCLLEAGPPDTFPLIHVPGAFGYFMFSRKYNWAFEAEVDPTLRNGTALFCPRGKGLGGSSSINGMLYIRGHRADYDHWAALGNPGWSFDEVLPYFKRSEANVRGASRFHGATGELVVSDSANAYSVSKVFMDAAREIGLPRTDDFNGEQQEGFGAYQLTINDGRRWSAADAFLHPVRSRSNLTVISGAHVTRIELDGKRATGVTYRHRGEERTLRAGREVILSAGAYGSPQILMLSGIGDPRELSRHGIENRHTLRGVGENLQEHPDSCAGFLSEPHGGIRFTAAGIAQILAEGVKYFGAKKGKLRTTITEVGGFFKSTPDAELPDVQLHALPLLFDDSGRDLGLMRRDGISCHVCVLRPKSRGAIRLRNQDPTAAPVIDHRFFSDASDMKVLVSGMRIAIALLEAPAFAPYRKVELLPGAGKRSDEDIERACRDHMGLVYHPVGTCKMGRDEMAVVGPDLRVHGIEGLRVVDASIMPTVIGGNTNAPTIMIAEKASDMILADCAKPALEVAHAASSSVPA
jgi:choline dehydrogenase-like flavoprotein